MPAFPRFCAIVVALLAGACDRSPADLREWTPEDHKHTSVPNRGQVQVDRDAGPKQAAPSKQAAEIDDVVWITWRRTCTPCHGTLGRGDGPQGPMVKATDLSNPSWQRGATDEQIADAIVRGKGTMPAFDLPESTVTGMVKLVRLLDLSRRRRAPVDAAMEASSALDGGRDAPSPRPDAGTASAPRGP